MSETNRNNKRGLQKSKPAQQQSKADGGSNYDDVTASIDNSLNPHEPIPLELENVFGFSPGGNKFIPFFNGTNKFYGFNGFFINILNWRKESPTQNACIVSKTNYAIGDGIFVTNVDKDRVDPKFNDFVRRCNPQPEGLNRVLKQVFDNFFTFGNVPIEIVRGSAGGKKFLYVYVKNTLDCRKAWPNGNNESDAMIVSRWFRKPGVYNLTEKFNIRIPFYKMGPGNKKECWIEDKTDNQGQPLSSGVFRTAIWLKNDFPGYDHYGIPSWLPSMRSAILEGATSQFNIDNIENNMVVGGVLVLAGNVTQPEATRIANTVTKKYTGKGKTGRTIVIASEDGISDSKYTPQDTYKQGSFVELDRLCASKIILANEWDESFLGSHEGASKAASGAFLNELYQQKIKTVIKPVHRVIKDDFLAPLCEIADEWLGTQWSKYDLDIQISNLFDDTTEASTTVMGLNSLLGIIDKVANGILPLENAKNLVMMKFGMDEKEVNGIFDGIKVQPKEDKGIKTIDK